VVSTIGNFMKNFLLIAYFHVKDLDPCIGVCLNLDITKDLAKESYLEVSRIL
jgi:hypothetical protein